MNARLVACALALTALGACSEERSPALQGYVEGEFVLVAAPAAGVLTRLNAQRGQHVEAGAAVFELDRTNEEAARREEEQRVKTADERLANLRAGRRPPEIAASAAQVEQARAANALSLLQLRQQEKLYEAGFISKAQMDAARTSYERDLARLNEAEAQGRLARQSIGREAEIKAAIADADAARASLAQAEWRLAQRTGRAPAAALVQDTYFVEGEWVPAGRPVASLLPAQNVKIRFFLPEVQLGRVQIGDRIRVSCDGCPSAVDATISYVSSQAEYTPPVLYNRESRAKLVFMVEARPSPANAARLRPGQPVDIELSGTPPS